MLYNRNTMETVLAKTMMNNSPDPSRTFMDYLDEATKIVLGELKPSLEFVRDRQCIPIQKVKELPKEIPLSDYAWRAQFKCNEVTSGKYVIGPLDKTISYNSWTKLEDIPIPEEVLSRLLKDGVIKTNRAKTHIILPISSINTLDEIAQTTHNRFITSILEGKMKRFIYESEKNFLLGFFELMNYVSISPDGKGVITELSEPDTDFDVFDLASDIGHCFIRYLDSKEIA